MNEINKMNLSEHIKFLLSKIIGFENYLHQDINQRKSCNKKLSKYVTTFDYIGKILIVLSPTSSGFFIISSANHDKILMLAKSKLNSIEMLEISHEKFDAIIKEKEKYEMMKQNVRDVNEKQNMSLNSVNSRKIMRSQNI